MKCDSISKFLLKGPGLFFSFSLWIHDFFLNFSKYFSYKRSGLIQGRKWVVRKRSKQGKWVWCYEKMILCGHRPWIWTLLCHVLTALTNEKTMTSNSLSYEGNYNRWNMYLAQNVHIIGKNFSLVFRQEFLPKRSLIK